MPLEELDFAASVGGCAPRAACAVPLAGDGERAKRGERGERGERGFNTTGALAAGVRTGKGPVFTSGISPL